MNELKGWLKKKEKKKKRVDTTVDYAGVKSIKYYIELFLCQFKNAANETPPTVHRLFFFFLAHFDIFTYTNSICI